MGELRCSYSLSLEILTVMLVAGADEAAMERSGVLSSEVCNGVSRLVEVTCSPFI